MIQQTLLKEGGTDEVESFFTVSHAHHSCFKFNPAAFIEHVGQGDTTCLLRKAVGNEAVKEAFGIRAADEDFREGGHVHNADAFSYGLAFCRDHIVQFRAPKAVDVFRLHPLWCKPTRAFVAIDLFIDRAFGFQCFIERTRFNWTTCQTVEMWERNFVAQAVILFRLNDLPLFRGVIAKAARIKFAHRDVS